VLTSNKLDMLLLGLQRCAANRMEALNEWGVGDHYVRLVHFTFCKSCCYLEVQQTKGPSDATGYGIAVLALYYVLVY